MVAKYSHPGKSRGRAARRDGGCSPILRQRSQSQHHHQGVSRHNDYVHATTKPRHGSAVQEGYGRRNASLRAAAKSSHVSVVQEGFGRHPKRTVGVVETMVRTSIHSNSRQLKLEHVGTVNHNFDSFYFTNVSDDITYSSLRQGFEVCGIMEDVYLARKRNVNGVVFGFVCYAKVKDIDKLLKAVNNVWFGDCEVVAKVSCFDRFGNRRFQGSTLGEGEKHNKRKK